MTKQQFEELLAWLDPDDRGRAGEKYESIRRSLIKIFTWGGCVNAEEMADETVNRVSAKVEDLRPTYKGNPALYFYGVAKRLTKECWRSTWSHVPLDEASDIAAPAPDEDEDEETLRREAECLRRCLNNLPPGDRELILAYYMKDKQAKIDHRKELARRLGILSNALRVKAYRIRAVLEDCIERCLAESSGNETD
jgi:RNA polymerase sigma factor (sigma-70 family)